MQTSHTPGHSRSRYVTGKCRCPLCTQANTDYQRNRYRQRHRPDGSGVAPLVDANATRDRLSRILATGETIASIARSTRIPRTTLTDIAAGRTKRTARSVHNAVVAHYRSHVARNRNAMR